MKTDQTRRHFINQAAKGFLGVSALSSLPIALQSAGVGASKLKQEATAKRVIYLYMSGGMSHLDTLDPKASGDFMGPTKQIKTKVDGMVLSDYLPRLAKHADKLAIINSMFSDQGAHKQGNYFMHTSYKIRSSIRHPAMGAWLMNLKGRGNPTMPGNIMIGKDSNHPGAGFFESKLSPLTIADPDSGLQHSVRAPNISEEQFQFHLDLSRKLDEPFLKRYDQKNVRAYTEMYNDAIKLMDSPDLAAFDLSKESKETAKKYGENPLGKGCLLARRLIENDVRFVEVSYGSWDTHSSNFVNVPEKAEILDTALSALLDDLEQRGLLDDTLIVLATEFGRTPEINTNEGRDHHPQAFSCLFAGGGIQGGQVYGKTNENGSKVIENHVKVPDFNATIGYALGLPLDQVLYSPSMRPFTLASKGKPLVSLFD